MKTARAALAALLFILALAWIFMARLDPVTDQLYVLESAVSLAQGKATPLRLGGYLYHLPHQIGFTGICVLFVLLFGNSATIAIQIMNAACFALIYLELSELGARLGLRPMQQLTVMLLGFMFLPLLQYTTFVYGTLLSLIGCLLALDLGLRYLKKPSTRLLLGSGAGLGIALVAKSNALILGIALGLAALAEAIRQRHPRLLALPLFLACCVCGALILPQRAALLLYRTGALSGNSPVSYIAMGLQESDRAPGWYNGYVDDSYGSAGYDTHAQTETALADIRASLRHFLSDAPYAWNFFTKKLASEWNNPTFQGAWIGQVSRGEDTSPAVNALLSPGPVYDMLFQFLNLFQFTVLVGSLFFCIFRCFTATDAAALSLPLAFLGGFAFHLIWEAKCQYTVVYFVLLFPCAVAGWNEAFAVSRRMAKPSCSSACSPH